MASTLIGHAILFNAYYDIKCIDINVLLLAWLNIFISRFLPHYPQKLTHFGLPRLAGLNGLSR